LTPHEAHEWLAHEPHPPPALESAAASLRAPLCEANVDIWREVRRLWQYSHSIGASALLIGRKAENFFWHALQ
jgi:hypothetical protein